MRVLTASQMKMAEQNAINSGTAEITLMENAGASAYRVIENAIGSKLTGMNCTVLCGSGNNGGDGFVVGRLLSKTAKKVTIILVNSLPKTKSSAEMYEMCKDTNCTILDIGFDLREALIEISKSDLIVDAVFGTGFHGNLPEKMLDVFEYANNTDAIKVALDLPSGANADTGEADKNSFVADVTISFGSAKMGHITSPTKELSGNLVVCDIGIFESAYDNIGTVAYSITKSQIPDLLPKRKPDSHKGDFGKLLIIAGSNDMSGAAALSTLSALRTGVGLCTLASTKTVIDRVASNIYEPTFITLETDTDGTIKAASFEKIYPIINNFDTICIGMGLKNTDNAKDLVANVLKYAKGTVLIDADGINALSSCINLCKDTEAKVILTPHPGEMSRLTGKTVAEIQSDRITIAKDFAKEYGVTLVLKGANTVIATPKGEIYINSTGNSGLSRGGSGDVLSGIIASLSAQGLSPLVACLVGVYVHGYTADKVAKDSSKQGMLPTDVINTLPYALGELNNK